MNWWESPYTGLFTSVGTIPLRPHDPEVTIAAGELFADAHRPQISTGGAAWDAEQAMLACAGEAIERMMAYPFPEDEVWVGAYADCPAGYWALAPEDPVLFHPDQYIRENFPFEMVTSNTKLRWYACRAVRTGEVVWVPQELIYLFPSPEAPHRICPGLSTGLSCGRVGDPVLLRGLQEVIERDALMGAWWGRYPVEIHKPEQVLELFPESISRRILRPNLDYRFYRIDSPYSSHVTMVSLTGEDHEGWCFSIGSACREDRHSSWEKALLESIHSRHYVRQLLQDRDLKVALDCPTDFSEHAVYFSVNPEKLGETVLASSPDALDTGTVEYEGLTTLLDKLERFPVLFRLLTPPNLPDQQWVVLRCIVPGLQPMHGHHGFPMLGGSLWGDRSIDEWHTIPPHPFP